MPFVRVRKRRTRALFVNCGWAVVPSGIEYIYGDYFVDKAWIKISNNADIITAADRKKDVSVVGLEECLIYARANFWKNHVEPVKVTSNGS